MSAALKEMQATRLPLQRPTSKRPISSTPRRVAQSAEQLEANPRAAVASIQHSRNDPGNRTTNWIASFRGNLLIWAIDPWSEIKSLASFGILARCVLATVGFSVIFTANAFAQQAATLPPGETAEVERVIVTGHSFRPRKRSVRTLCSLSIAT